MWNYTWNLTQQREMCTRRGHHAIFQQIDIRPMMLSNPSAQTHSKTVGIFARKKIIYLEVQVASYRNSKMKSSKKKPEDWLLGDQIFFKKRWVYSNFLVFCSSYIGDEAPLLQIRRLCTLYLSPNLRIIYPKAKNTKHSDRLFWNFCPIALWISDMETYYLIHLHN